MKKEVTKLVPTAIRVRRELQPGTSLLKRPNPGQMQPRATLAQAKRPPQASAGSTHLCLDCPVAPEAERRRI